MKGVPPSLALQACVPVSPALVMHKQVNNMQLVAQEGAGECHMKVVPIELLSFLLTWQLYGHYYHSMNHQCQEYTWWQRSHAL